MNDLGLHVIPILDTVILPNTRTKLSVDEKLGHQLKRQIDNFNGMALALTVREERKGSGYTAKLQAEDFYPIGTLVQMNSVDESSDGFLIYADGTNRVEVENLIKDGSTFYATFTLADDVDDMTAESKNQMIDFIKKSIHEISIHYKNYENYVKLIDLQKDVNSIIGHILPFMTISLDKKYELLRQSSLKNRGMLFIEYLAIQRESVELQVEMAQKYSKKNNKSHRENVLREQLKVIKEELGEDYNEKGNPEYYKARLETSEFPDEVREVYERELYKLENAGNSSSEANVSRNYLDLLLDLPWTYQAHDIDIFEAGRVLDKYHYGIEKVKQRIIEHLAVMKIQNEKQGSILLLVGPPGTGKTSLGKSIAEALGREYVRISLGGVRDEAEIRGHRRTYIGALPGRIIQGMKKAGTKNPVFVLDEIDKLSASHNGDPSSALLEVLDPKQNDSFADHYLEVPYDLSNVLFVATANNINTIPRPLLDRLEVIQVSSYTNLEKMRIGMDYLTKESLKEHGLTDGRIQFEEAAIKEIIDKYTREAGVRGLKKQIDSVIRKVIEKIVKGQVTGDFTVSADKVEELLGNQMARHSLAKEEGFPGVVTGLAWTPVGGDILFIEGTFMPGNGKMILTGQLGEVMKESATIGMSLVKSRLAEHDNIVNFNKNDIHIHVPSGSTPKDGPSAGITLVTALASLATGKAVHPKLAMTGEVTLSGQVLPVGGIKEKIIAAHRAGIQEIIMCQENEQDLKEVPSEVMQDLRFYFVTTIEQVLEKALNIKIKSNTDLFEASKEDGQIGFKL